MTFTKAELDKLNAAMASTGGKGWDGKHVPGLQHCVGNGCMVVNNGGAHGTNHGIKARGLKALSVRVGGRSE